jgi:Tfp pilus assembly protein PilN
MKINLIPEVKQEQLRIQKLNATATTVATVVFFVIGSIIICLSIYNIIKTTQIATAKKNITKVNKQLEAYKDLEETVYSLENGLKEAKQIITGGAKWSKFFEELEKATPGDVQISQFEISGNEIKITAKPREVASIDRFIKSFSNYKVDNKNLFENVSVPGYTTDPEKGISFQSTLTLIGGILW